MASGRQAGRSRPVNPFTDESIIGRAEHAASAFTGRRRRFLPGAVDSLRAGVVRRNARSGTTGGAGGEDLPLAEWGEQLYTSRNCNTCHTVDGSGLTGPTWLGTWGQTRAFADGTSAMMDDSYVLESLYDPGAKIVQGFQPQMPSYEALMSDRDVRAIAAYMRMINGVATTADTSLILVTDSTAAAPETTPASPDE